MSARLDKVRLPFLALLGLICATDLSTVVLTFRLYDTRSIELSSKPNDIEIALQIIRF